MNKNPALSVVVVSFNSVDITRKCLGCLEKSIAYSKENIEVIVVDNNSKDGSVEMIKSEFANFRLIVNKENLGFSKANNQGMEASRGKYILLINSDLFVNDNTLKKSIEVALNGKWDMFSCELRYVNGETQRSWGNLPNKINIMWSFLFMDIFNKHTFHARNLKISENQDVGWFMGAFVMFDRKIWEKVGGFDENFFMYMEEVEWMKRVWDAGFRIGYTKSFWVTHVDKGSSKNLKSENSIYWEAWGLLYYFKKHYPKDYTLVYWAIKIGSFVRAILLGAKSIRLFKVYMRIVNEL